MVDWLLSQSSVSGAVAAVAWCLFASVGLGLTWLPRTGWRKHGDAFLLAIVLGLNLLAFFGILAALTGITMRVPVWAPLAVAGLLGIGFLYLHCRAAIRRGPFRRRWIPAIVFFGVVALLFAGPSLCFPITWDEMVYQIMVPRRWLADGYPAVYLDLPYSGFPSLAQVLFWMMGPVDSLIAPRLFVYICWLLLLIILYRLLRDRLARAHAMVLTAAFGLSGTIMLVASDTYVELLIALDLAAMFLALRNRTVLRRAGSWRLPVILGILAGGAAAVKLTGCALFFVPMLWLLPRPSKRPCRLRAAVRMAVFALAAVAMAAPFFLRPLLATGNPTYPYYDWLFNDSSARSAMSRYHHELGSVRYGLPSIAGFIAAPVLLAFRSLIYDGCYGWQLLPLLGLACVGVLTRIRRSGWRAVLFPAWTCFGLYVFWFLTSQQARFLVPAVFAFMLVAALGLRALRCNALRWAATTVIIGATLFSLRLGNSGYYYYGWAAALGRIRMIDFVHTGTKETYLPAVDAVYEATPEDARLLLLFEHRGLYFPRETLIGTPLFQERLFTPLEAMGGPHDIMAGLHREGITHVLVALTPGGPDLLPAHLQQCEPFARDLSVLVQEGDLRTLWRSPHHALHAVRPPQR